MKTIRIKKCPKCRTKRKPVVVEWTGKEGWIYLQCREYPRCDFSVRINSNRIIDTLLVRKWNAAEGARKKSKVILPKKRRI